MTTYLLVASAAGLSFVIGGTDKLLEVIRVFAAHAGSLWD